MLYLKKYHSFDTSVVLLVLHTHNYTDSNKLEISFGIALYYDRDYVVYLHHKIFIVLISTFMAE